MILTYPEISINHQRFLTNSVHSAFQASLILRLQTKQPWLKCFHFKNIHHLLLYRQLSFQITSFCFYIGWHKISISHFSIWQAPDIGCVLATVRFWNRDLKTKKSAYFWKSILSLHTWTEHSQWKAAFLFERVNLPFVSALKQEINSNKGST